MTHGAPRGTGSARRLTSAGDFAGAAGALHRGPGRGGGPGRPRPCWPGRAGRPGGGPGEHRPVSARRIEEARRAAGAGPGDGVPGRGGAGAEDLSLGMYYAGDLRRRRGVGAAGTSRSTRRPFPAGSPGAAPISWPGPARIRRRRMPPGGTARTGWPRPGGQVTCAVRHLSWVSWPSWTSRKAASRRRPRGCGNRLEIAARTGDPLCLLNCLDGCGHVCAATHRWAEAVTVWAAHDAQVKDHGFTDVPQDEQRRQAPLRAARQALGPVETSRPRSAAPP